MKKIITASLLGGAITASFLGAGAANAATSHEYDNQTPGQLVQESANRSVQVVVGTVQAQKPLRQAFIAGDDATVAVIVGNIVDGPQWAADPAIEAAAQVLPKPLGGTNGDPFTADGDAKHDADGKLMQFRNTTMLKARDTTRKNVQAGAAKAGDVRDTVNAALKPKAARDTTRKNVQAGAAKAGDVRDTVKAALKPKTK